MTAVHWPPWFFSNETDSWGPMWNVADSLARALNFKFTIEAPEDGQWGVKTPDNWTGMVGMLYNNRSDLGLGPIAVTEERSSIVNFGSMLITDYLTILSGYPSQAEPNAFGSLMAFDWTVWLTMIVSITAVSLLSVFFERISYPEKISNRYMRRFSHYIETYLKAVFAEGSVEVPETDSLRILFQMWWMGTIVLMTAFTGHMKAMMMVKPEPIRINSMSELAKRDMPVFVWRGTAYEALLRTSDSVDYMNVYKLVTKHHGALSTDELYSKANMDQVIHSQAVIVSNVVVMRYHVARTCGNAMAIGNYHFATVDFFPHKFAMIFHKSFPRRVSAEINKRTRWIVELGLVNRWMYSQYGGLEECAAMAKAGDPTRALDLEETQSVFWVWLMGLLSSVLFLVAERRCRCSSCCCCCSFCRCPSYKRSSQPAQMLSSLETQSNADQPTNQLTPRSMLEQPKLVVAVSPYVDAQLRHRAWEMQLRRYIGTTVVTLPPIKSGKRHYQDPYEYERN